jgi:hypothetical protein
MGKKRFLLLTDSLTFPLLGAGATLAGCRNDTINLINRVLMTIWKAGGYDKGYVLSDVKPGALNEADNVREKMAEIISLAGPDDVILQANSSHGSEGTDWLTGERMQVTVCHKSTWDQARSFMSRMDYARAYEKLKPGTRVFNFYDSCKSGNMGANFRLLQSLTRTNRWLEPPPDVQRDLDKLPMAVLRAPQQVCTMAGCLPDGFCGDIQGPDACGVFSRARDGAVLATPNQRLGWYTLGANVNERFARDGEEQRCVCDGPNIPFDLD